MSSPLVTPGDSLAPNHLAGSSSESRPHNLVGGRRGAAWPTRWSPTATAIQRRWSTPPTGMLAAVGPRPRAVVPRAGMGRSRRPTCQRGRCGGHGKGLASPSEGRTRVPSWLEIADRARRPAERVWLTLDRGRSHDHHGTELGLWTSAAANGQEEESGRSRRRVRSALLLPTTMVHHVVAFHPVTSESDHARDIWATLAHVPRRRPSYVRIGERTSSH